MKIEQLDLAAFGPFTGLRLDFSGSGLQVVHGPNEAGKSSALRGLTAWLFGIPERTRDDFLHPRTELLVGGTLARQDRRLTFYRRKKRKGDIVDQEGNPLDPGPVAEMLAGLDRDLFLALHGIDHDALVTGGREILAHRGEIGQALFSAGAGLGVLHRALEAMEAEKNTLYKPRGRNQAINDAIGRQRRIARQIREQACPPEEWQQRRDELARLDRELAGITGERTRIEADRSRLERLLRAAPLLARLETIQARLAELGGRLVLPDDFSRRREEAQRQVRLQGQRCELVRQQLARIRDQEGELVCEQALLERAGRIEDLVQQLGAIRKAAQDRPRLEGMRSMLKKEAAATMKLLLPGGDPDDPEPLLPLLGNRQRLLALAREHALLCQREEDLRREQKEIRRGLAQVEQRVRTAAQPPEPDGLADAIRQGRRAGDLDGRISALAQDIGQLRTEIEEGLQLAGRWPGRIHELPDLALPSPAAVRDRAGRLDELRRRERELDRAGEETGRELRQVTGRITRQALAGAPPTEEELTGLRQGRDRGWRLLLRRWIGGEEIDAEADRLSGGAPLHEWVEERIRASDQVSDRLRFEAERVHNLASLTARREELSALLDDIRGRRAELAEQQKQWQAEWQALWQPVGIEADTPPVMEQWLDDMTILRRQARRLLTLEQEGDALRRRRTELVAGLATALRAVDGVVPDQEELEAALVAAETRHQELIQARDEYRDLKREQARLRREMGRLDQEREEHGRATGCWREQWRKLAVLPGRDGPLTPEEIQDVLDQAEEVRSRHHEAGEFALRLRGMERDREAFAGQVRAVAAACARDLAGTEPETAVLELKKRLEQAQADKALQERIRAEQREAETELAEATTLLAAAERELAQLVRLAGCEREEELAGAEERSREQAELHGQLGQTRQDLEQALAGMDQEEARQALAELDLDTLPAWIRELEEKVRDELEPAIRRLAEQRGEAAALLAAMDGSDTAARLAAEEESCLAEIRRDAARYIRLHLACELIRREMENYRQANQGPVLALASEIFSRLTLGSFAGLGTDLDSRGEPVLVGLRPGARRSVEVAAMSTGSRDQLFLALRLASIRHRADQGRPMFHIFDDILINFDEARCRATLAELAELGQNSQLVLFTHQAGIAEMAARLPRTTLHELGR